MANHSINPCQGCQADLGEDGGDLCDLCWFERNSVRDLDPLTATRDQLIVWHQKYVGTELRSNFPADTEEVRQIVLDQMADAPPRRCRYCRTGEGSACDCV